MNFRVGQKVVAVAPPADLARQLRCPKASGAASLTRGAIYTVRDIDARFLPSCGVAGLRLVEVSNPMFQTSVGAIEAAYHPACFRPLIDTTKQVEAIKSLIKPIFEGKTVEMVQ